MSSLSEKVQPAASATDAEALRRELAMERLRRQVYESVARQELLSHTLSCLVEMVERETPRLSACIVHAQGAPDATDTADHGGSMNGHSLPQGVAGRGGDAMVADSIESASLRGLEWPASVELWEELAAAPTWASEWLDAGSPSRVALWSLPLPGRETADPVVGSLVMLLCDTTEPSDAERAVASLAAELAGFAIGCAWLADRAVQQLMHDPLTGLPNATLLKDRLAQATEVARRQRTTTAVLLIDIDGLREVNESLGRGAGDEMLRRLATRLRGGVRRSDTLARLGGDKFALIGCVTNGVPDVESLANKVVSLVTTSIRIGDREVSVGLNIGISLFPVDSEDANQLVQAAEVALHRSKTCGRNSIQYFKPAGGTDALASLDMESRLRRAVEFALMSQALGGGCGDDPAGGKLELHYQPQVDQSGRVVGVEALSRWQDPVLGRVPPDRFIAAAERNGLIIPFGQWALRQAAAQSRKWRDRFGSRSPRVAVNVSAVQFADHRFLNDVATVISVHHLTPGMLELELTESVLMHDADDAAKRIGQLRQMGVAIAIDDFGTGYSSLAYLHRLTIDTLKVDRSFVAGMSGERRGPGAPASGPLQGSGAAVTRAIISMGRSLGMNVLAEGVETDAQRQLLTRMGCDQMQGYLFSRPVPPDEFERLIVEGAGTLPLPQVLARPA